LDVNVKSLVTSHPPTSTEYNNLKASLLKHECRQYKTLSMVLRELLPGSFWQCNENYNRP